MCVKLIVYSHLHSDFLISYYFLNNIIDLELLYLLLKCIFNENNSWYANPKFFYPLLSLLNFSKWGQVVAQRLHKWTHMGRVLGSCLLGHAGFIYSYMPKI